MSDFALLHYAVPFAHRLTRSCVVIVLEGEARFEEMGTRIFAESDDLVVTDQNRAGTEAYAPTTTKCARALFVDWDPKVFGGSFETFESGRVPRVDRARLEVCARDLGSEEAGGEIARRAAVDAIAILRSVGLPIMNVSLSDLTQCLPAPDEQRLMSAITRQLSNLELHPSFDEIADELGWSERHTNRRIAHLFRKHEIPWSQWRTMLHSTRMINVFRVLSTPGATTELAAKKAGFRSPAALCHALAKANLPSPGVLAKTCQSNRLGAWTSIFDRSSTSPL